MARAEPVPQDPVEAEIDAAGDVMMLLISRSVWDALAIESRARGSAPGAVLSQAVAKFIEDHGSAEAREYLARLRQQRKL